MIEFLLSPIDPDRAHQIGNYVAWHGRLMALAWGVLFPLGILIARFWKITPRQNWPRELDNQTWWHAHLGLQYTGGAVMMAALGLILMHEGGGGASHGYVGWVLSGFAVTKGGPTEPGLRGDHYDMTRRRLIFEHVHKTAGYGLVALASWGILSGLWLANAPLWMWLGLASWWCALIGLFILLQRRGMAVDTYQAIWGPDPDLPGNRRRPVGWGISRRGSPAPDE